MDFEGDSGSTYRARMRRIAGIVLIPGNRRSWRLSRVDGRHSRSDWTLVAGQPAPAIKERLMRSLRYSVAVFGLIALGAAAEHGGRLQPQGPAQVPADPARRGLRYARRRGGHRRLQGRAGDRRSEADRRLRAPRRAGQAAPPVRHHQRRQVPQPVELLPGRLRGLSRERPRRRPDASTNAAGSTAAAPGSR